jgi:hypothetical protein
MRPRKRTERLLTAEVEGEIVAYDLDRLRAHRLSETAAAVFELADGARTVDEIAAAVRARFGIPRPLPLVQLALQALDRAHLLVRDPAVARPPRALTRRRLLKRIAVAAALLPVVSSLTAPTALAAASSVSSGECVLTVPPCPNLPCSDQPGKRCKQVLTLCQCTT